MNAGTLVTWETRLSIVVWVFAKTQLLMETLKIRDEHQEESVVSLEVEHSLVGCARSKLLHSSMESVVISLDAGLRMDGILALDLWDVVIEVLHSLNNKKSSTQEVFWKPKRIQGGSSKRHANV